MEDGDGLTWVDGSKSASGRCASLMRGVHCGGCCANVGKPTCETEDEIRFRDGLDNDREGSDSTSTSRYDAITLAIAAVTSIFMQTTSIVYQSDYRDMLTKLGSPWSTPSKLPADIVFATSPALLPSSSLIFCCKQIFQSIRTHFIVFADLCMPKSL